MTIKKVDHSLEDIMFWADGTWCYRKELSQMTHMSDDYQVLYFGTAEYDKYCTATSTDAQHQAEAMNENMRKYGTINKPKDKCIKHDVLYSEGDICHKCEQEADAYIAKLNKSIEYFGAVLKVQVKDFRSFLVPVYSFTDAKRLFMSLDFNSIESCHIYCAGDKHNFK